MTLHGVWGKMTSTEKPTTRRAGVPPMTAFRTLLKDEELAAVLDVCAQHLGQPGGAVSAPKMSSGFAR